MLMCLSKVSQTIRARGIETERSFIEIKNKIFRQQQIQENNDSRHETPG